MLLLILTGCSLFSAQVHAYTLLQKTNGTTANVVNELYKGGSTVTKDIHTGVISRAATEAQRQDLWIEITENEIEEEEFLSSKKYVQVSNINSFLSTQPLGYFFFVNKKCPRSCDHLSLISSHRGYLVLQVFRL